MMRAAFFVVTLCALLHASCLNGVTNYLGSNNAADLATSADLATIDQSIPPDATRLPDLSTFDLIPVPDLSCAPGLTLCEISCRDLNTDPLHCGSCKTACPANNKCDGGHCIACPQGMTTVCHDTCVSLETDPANCGGCGKACAQGHACAQSVCQ